MVDALILKHIQGVVNCRTGDLELVSHPKLLIGLKPRHELRRCVRARTRAMCGRTCACACEIHSGKCAGCACVRPIFGRAMCDRTFAHFLEQKDKI